MFKSSDSIKPVLNKIKQKEGLSTAILFLDGQEQQFLHFILEDECYALYRLAEDRLKPLLFSDYFRETDQMEGVLDLYRVSPVFFKSLLMMAQASPRFVLTSELVDLKRLLSHLSRNKKEAVLTLKNKKQMNLFYFIGGILRDAYLEDMDRGADSEENQLTKVFSKDGLTRIELYDGADVHAARDSEYAMKHFSDNAGQKEDDGPLLDEDDATPVPLDLLSEGKAVGSPEKNNASTLWVEVLTGSRAGFLIRVSKEAVKLGRGNVDVQLNDPQISRVHAELEWTPSGLFIRDHQSTNGLFVNDSKEKEKRLSLNDEIRLGDIRLKVVPAS